MKIITQIGGRWKDDKKAEEFFALHKEWIETRIPELKEQFHFKPPSKLLLRPFYFKNGFSEYYGRAEYSPFNTIPYHLMLCVPVCLKEKDKGLWVTDHELAHIVCAVKHYDWSHGEKFKEVNGWLKGTKQKARANLRR